VTEALSGTGGPLGELGGASPTTFDQLWASEVTQPINEGIMQPVGSNMPESLTQSFAATTEPGAAGMPPEIATGATTAGQGNVPATVASALEQPAAATPSLDTAAINTAVEGQGPLSLTAPAAGATAAPAAAAPAAAAPSGISGTLSSILASPVTRAVSLAAPLGMLGMTLARGQPNLPPAMQQNLDQLGPTEALANQQLTGAANNQITPAQAQQIATYEQNARNQLYQFYASQGRNPNQDTDFLQGVAQIEANGVAMRQQFIDSMITHGLQAQGVVSSELTAAANLQVAQDAAFQASIASALQSFGLVAAISSRA
jgi:hypothetical protein